ncbi:SRPBCC family protein [Lapillicoccus sp.]|uniref:SRPBCC family protein n=1 Tax=Lapillicoccus sp. TaxID=1909287 RepID=UPI0025DDAD3C|nr:SRPBCC family protein [Lapillicoccus sp.]
MGDYEESTTVAVSANELFGYLQDVKNLPHYLPRLTSVTPSGDGTYTVTAHIQPEGGEARDVEGEAWMSVKTEGRTLAWGSAGPHNYEGELDVEPGDAEGTSRLTVRLHTERAEGPSIESGLKETIAGLKDAAESASEG